MAVTFFFLSATDVVVHPLLPKCKEFLSYEIRVIANRANVEMSLSLRGDPQRLRPSKNMFPSKASSQWTSPSHVLGSLQGLPQEFPSVTGLFTHPAQK